ncbi:rhomboid family intramembrane serine protease [Dokdonia donghaensis]|uniref:Protease n=1 Tax=Dokdonia donghaensis DSW-1 TaxID=1300343 RepID=A0A0A2H0U3_9FLAO|nr:rhomboid family intramembrane serine protease [Dokdonia donghaensis]ANH61680.1 Rhomboid protease AarA [Dokdonia donghaensis DSW-1]KGO06270.1 protease [Dokdonia donghaensis DSW-1]
MGRITETVKILLIVNVIFYLGSLFIIKPDPAMQLFALWFIENPSWQVWQPLTHMFMHDLSSPMHIAFNMYALWMFGSPIENALGQKRFIFFYFSAGLGAALIHTLVNYYHFNNASEAIMALGFNTQDITDILTTGSFSERIPRETAQSLYESFSVPAVGASGAIMGVLVAFGMLFPNASLGLLFIPVPIKAKYFIPILVGIDLFSGVTGFSIFGANIANWAHLGGALFGFIMMFYWKKQGLGRY